MSYAQLWNENFPEHPVDGGFHVLRIGKEIISFDYRWFKDFPDAWEAFIYLRELYDLAKKIRRLK